MAILVGHLVFKPGGGVGHGGGGTVRSGGKDGPVERVVGNVGLIPERVGADQDISDRIIDFTGDSWGLIEIVLCTAAGGAIEGIINDITGIAA